MNDVTIQTRTATDDRQCERLHHYATGKLGGAVDLVVDRERGIFTVRWNVNRGNGWAKGWGATMRGPGAETRALAFAAEKWPTLVAWLEFLEPVESNGAAHAFSVQVASMR